MKRVEFGVHRVFSEICQHFFMKFWINKNTVAYKFELYISELTIGILKNSINWLSFFIWWVWSNLCFEEGCMANHRSLLNVSIKRSMHLHHLYNWQLARILWNFIMLRLWFTGILYNFLLLFLFLSPKLGEILMKK